MNQPTKTANSFTVKDFLILALSVAFVVLVMIQRSRVNDILEKSNQQQKEYQKKYDDLEQQLKQSEQQRNRLDVSLDSLNNISKSLVLADSLKQLQIDSLSGLFDHLHGSELEKRMIKEYKDYK